MSEPTVDDVVVGSRWSGITGNRMTVIEVDGERVRLSYDSDPEDNFWEDAYDVAAYLNYIG